MPGTVTCFPFFLHLLVACLVGAQPCICTHTSATGHTERSENNSWKGVVFVHPRLSLRLADLAASTSNHWVILQTHLSANPGLEDKLPQHSPGADQLKLLLRQLLLEKDSRWYKNLRIWPGGKSCTQQELGGFCERIASRTIQMLTLLDQTAWKPFHWFHF